MKIIGRMEGGDLLVVMPAGEMAACETLARGVVFQIAAHEVERAPSAAPVKVSRKDPKTQRKSGRVQSGPLRDKVCAVCGKKFRDTSRTNTRQVCSVKCAKQRERARNSRKQSPPPQRAPDINPADPSLTDAQRAELLRRREAMIRDSVERLGS